MPERPFILLVDDEPEFLAMYREILSELPSHPEVHTTHSGARAIAMLESVAYAVLVCDLKMPSMDGLQVLAIVRRKFPHLRTVIITGLVDEQYRIRAYAMGVDLFIGKPKCTEESQRLLDCIESLLDLEQQSQSGFRGIQQKSLVDIIQLECLCQSSAVLRVRGPAGDGSIWFIDGQIIDAEVPGVGGEDAFRRILSWKTGNFEILPAEPERQRSIHNSNQGLLLASAQAIDESTPNALQAGDKPAEGEASRALRRFDGVQFGLVSTRDTGVISDAWALDSAETMAKWLAQTLAKFQALGEEWGVGDLRQLDATTLQHQVLMARHGGFDFAVAFDKSTPASERQATFNQIKQQWES
jgi:CheY-like chemotaxis protein